jgi:hypothetical protein
MPVTEYQNTQPLAVWTFSSGAPDFSDLYENWFLNEYLLLTKKYAIAVSSVDVCKELIGIPDTLEYVLSLKAENKNTAPLLLLYGHERFDSLFYPEAFLCPSVLYVESDGDIAPRLVVETETLTSLNAPAAGTPPVSVTASGKKILVALHGNGWLPGKGNDALAGLNGPRFNSFLRGVKRLMRAAGLTLEFSDHSQGAISEDGIYFNGHVLQAEVIASVLNSDVENWMPLRRDYDFPLLDELSAEEARGLAKAYAEKYDLNTIINDQTRTVYYDSFENIDGAAWMVEADLPPSSFNMHQLSYVVSTRKGRVEYIINDSGFVKYPHLGAAEFSDEDIEDLGFDVLE